MFWPPRPGTRLPPTKATSARPQTAPSSPIVSIRMTGGELPAGETLAEPLESWVRRTTSFPVPSQPLGHSLKPIGVSGHQDQPQAGMLEPSRPVRIQRGGFLTVHRTSCNEDQVGVRKPQLGCEDLGSWRCSDRFPARHI